MQHYMPGVNKV